MPARALQQVAENWREYGSEWVEVEVEVEVVDMAAAVAVTAAAIATSCIAPPKSFMMFSNA